MSGAEPVRPGEPRLREALGRLEEGGDAWVATAGEEPGAPYLVPLSFIWDGTTVLIATPEGSRTGRNLAANGSVRLGVGETRDVVLVEGTADTVAPPDLSEEEADLFATRTGFDPRQLSTPYLYFRIRPARIQSWRGGTELDGRELMSNGTWLMTD
ncbi:hypothetical protein RKD23_000910 [Streptomyces sp. SAI-170]|uniref:pyridoxamine 5'-phosphate oxidase family protein n=1 Tax=Streptomyces sp. SAI-170 TaxID=3377729 RepID=UPI003C79DAAF